MANTPFFQRGSVRKFTMLAATAAFLRCNVDTNGKAAICTKQQKSVGVPLTGYNAGDAGELLLNHQTGTTVMKASGAIAQNGRVFADDNGKVTAAGATGQVLEGIALSSATADGDLIEVLCWQTLPWVESITVANSAAVTATAAETTFGQTYVLAANTLQVGDVLEIESLVVATATNAADTLLIKMYIGASVIGTTLAAGVDVANNDNAIIRCKLVIRTIGAGGTMIADALVCLGVPGTATFRAYNLGSTAIDTTAAQTIDVKATWSSNNAGNSCRQELFHVRRTFGAAA